MNNPVSKSKLAATLAAAVLLVSTTAGADDSFEKEIEYRQGVMNILSWNTKHIGGMLKGKMPYDAEQIKTPCSRHCQCCLVEYHGRFSGRLHRG